MPFYAFFLYVSVCAYVAAGSADIWRNEWESQLPRLAKQLVHTLHAACSRSKCVCLLTGSFVVDCSPSLCFFVHLKVIILCPCALMLFPLPSLCLCLSSVYLISQSPIHLFLVAIIPSICFYPTILCRLDKNVIKSNHKFIHFCFDLHAIQKCKYMHILWHLNFHNLSFCGNFLKMKVRLICSWFIHCIWQGLQHTFHILLLMLKE